MNVDDDAQTRAVLRNLPARYVEILLLYTVEGLPMAEVAARLRLSRKAAERRWTNAIVLLCERMKKAEAKAKWRAGGGNSRGRGRLGSG